MLVEQVPSLYAEFMAVEYLLKRSHKVFPSLLANALDHTADNVSGYFCKLVMLTFCSLF